MVIRDGPHGNWAKSFFRDIIDGEPCRYYVQYINVAAKIKVMLRRSSLGVASNSTETIGSIFLFVSTYISRLLCYPHYNWNLCISLASYTIEGASSIARLQI